jgi:hypothetical protein
MRRERTDEERSRGDILVLGFGALEEKHEKSKRRRRSRRSRSRWNPLEAMCST